MKLHLPIGLLTAVLCAVSYAQAAIDRTLSGEVADGATHGNLTVTIGEGDYTSYNMYANSKPGYLGGAAHYEENGKECTLNTGNPQDIYSSIDIIVGDTDNNAENDPTINILMVEGRPINSVAGDKSVTVNSGSINLLYGGIVYEASGTSGNLSHTGNTMGSTYHYAYKDSANPADLNITINGGTVGQIRAGHSGKQEVYVYDFCKAAQEYDLKNGTNTYAELMNDKPWAISGDVTVEINGGTVDASYAGKTTAIMGAGGSGHSVDGSVTVNVSGGEVKGDIFAGPNNIYAEVKETYVNIRGGEITGNVYGGGDIDDGRTKFGDKFPDASAPTVKGNTQIILSGGTIYGNVYGAGIGDLVEGNTKVVIQGEGTTVNNGKIYGGGTDDTSTVKGDRILSFDNYTAGTGEDGYATVDWTKYQDFNALEVNNSEVNIGSLSADYESMSLSDANVKMDRIEVATDHSFEIKGNGRENSNLILTSSGENIIKVEGQLKLDGVSVADNHISSGPTLISSGTMEINNSIVNLTESHTLQVGDANGVKGTLDIKGSSDVSIGSNNAWLYGGSINVKEGSTLNLCSTNKDYNYRTLMGLSGGILDVSVTEGSALNSHATQLVMNFNDNTAVNITVDGEGSVFHQTAQTESLGYNYVIGTSGQWGEHEVNCGNHAGEKYQTVWSDKDTQGYVANSHPGAPSGTITYICAKGTDVYGAALDLVNNVSTTITASNGGMVKIDSALTYIGDVRDYSTYGDLLNKQANFNVKGKDSAISFDRMQIYAETNVNFADGTNGTFSASKIDVNEGATLNVRGGKDSGASFILTGSSVSEESLVVKGSLNVTGAYLEMKGVTSQMGIEGSGAVVIDNSKVDLSEGSTFYMGYFAGENGTLDIKGGSEFIGGATNAWLGGGTINVTDGSTMAVCNTADHNNYRTMMCLDGNDMTLNVKDNSEFISAASRFISNFSSDSTANITVDGSTFTQKAATVQDPNDRTITYLLDKGTDNKGNRITKDTNPNGTVNNVEVNITAQNGGKIAFESDVTYVGSEYDAGDYGDSLNKQANFKVEGQDSEISFNKMEIYAATNLENKGGTFSVADVVLHDKGSFNVALTESATFNVESGATVTLTDVTVSESTLHNGGKVFVEGNFAVNNATLAFTEGAGAINMSGASITLLDGVVFELILGDSATALFADPTATKDFSFTVLSGVDSLTAGKDLVTAMQAAFSKDQLQLTGVNANGELVDLLILGAEMTYAEGAVTISGTATIPEPTTATLSLLALAALASRRRRAAAKVSA